MKKKSRPTDGGGSWMDTYGDMVTLLMTFFIMLYSMSNVDANKWNVFVRSISPSQETREEQVDKVTVNSQIGEDIPAAGETIGSEDEIEEAIDSADPNTLYLTIANRLNEIGVQNAAVVRGEDYTYINFEDSTFFDGGKSTLTRQGQMVLTSFCRAIAPAAKNISQVNIMAHTAKANTQEPSDIRVDRTLSAVRGAEVSIYIQEQNIIEPEKLVNISYGEFRPIADNATREGRAKNRRVEILLLDKDAKGKGMDEYYRELGSGLYDNTTVITVGQSAAQSENE